MNILIPERELEWAKRTHCNRKCSECKYHVPSIYEDDTPLSYTPYSWWEGFCGINDMPISSDIIPTNCPLNN